MSPEIVALAMPIAVTLLSAVIVAILNSPATKSIVAAYTQKAEAETSVLVSNAMHSNNAMLRELVVVSMAYAEQHESEVVANFKSKADFVIARVSADPRFASLGQPLSAIELILEDVFQGIYESADKASKA